MQFHRSLAGIILSSLLPVSTAFGTGSIAAEPLQIAFLQDKSRSPDIGDPESRVFPLVVDFAGVLHIKGGMSAIAVGNPEIADASLADRRTVILTGRMAGTTNVIALDDAGRVLADVMIRVSSQKPGTVTVRRGTELQAYSCTSALCEGTTNGILSDANPLEPGTDG